MSIDLDTKEGRKEYLSEKLNDLLDGINESYGTVLVEELLNRLEITIKDFNDEMKVLCEQLVKNEEEKQQLLEMLRSSGNTIQGFSATNLKENSGNPFESFMSSGMPDISNPQEVKVENVSVESLPKIEQVVEEDLPEWEKKLAKLEKK